MYIDAIRILNYKSFQDSGSIEFKPGINIIIGQNNSGKTAFLECLSGIFDNIPHKDINLSHSFYEINNNKSEVTISLTLSKEEFKNKLNQLQHPLRIHLITDDNQGDTALATFLSWLHSNNNPVKITLNLSDSKGIYYWNNDIYKLSSYPCQINPKQPGIYPFVTVKNAAIEEIQNRGIVNAGIEDNILIKMFKLFRDTHIYRFYAERLGVGVCKSGTETVLKPNASNLAEVINVLQGKNPGKFKRYNKYVSIIFPQIKWVSVTQVDSTNIEISIWLVEPETEREDLPIKLSFCGTGVAQVLAILYVVLNSDEPQTIIIDEPQSFLHPGAARKLIEIIKDFKQHQFFISTHSPEIITASNPSQIIQLTYKDGKTNISEINIKDKNDMQLLLADLGIRLSDVFGSDNILWVEGQTEEKCFPLILENLTDIKLRGTQILALTATGDLEGKHANLVFDIYDRLSGGNTLFPPAIGFILDDEGKKDKDKEDLKRRSEKKGNKLHFLTRRLYENYLLDAEAIAHIINQEDSNKEQPISKEDIQNWLNNNKNKFMPKEASEDADWLKVVDGAKLLGKLFSEKNIPFTKTKHSYELTEWLVENKPECLREIVDLLTEILAPSSNS